MRAVRTPSKRTVGIGSSPMEEQGEDEYTSGSRMRSCSGRRRKKQTMHVDDRKTEGVVKNSTGRNIRRRRYGAALCTAGWKILHQLCLHGLWPRAATERNIFRRK